MRKSALAFALVLVAALSVHGALTPQPASAATGPKVVIIVGATHGATDAYRSYANTEYAEARKYTANVVKVYSPNATWAKVKAAVTGAAIVIYHGHGNGWPSPYTFDPAYTTKDGFGLNATAGNGDHNNKYYGEPYIDDLDFAPHAVVLLHNLCYAAGNSEPGQPQPTTAVAKQRADNYASAFLKAGASALIAGGHENATYYIRALFTTRQTLDQLWQAAPTFNDNVFSFASVRRPGKTVRMDPDQPGRNFYRSIAGTLTTRTEQVTGAAYAATDGDPSSLVVPGAASVGSAGTDLFDDELLTVPQTTLPAGTALRVTARAGTTAVYAVETLDGALSGYVAGSALVPRDSRGPNLWEIDDGTGAFSPNGDSSGDRITLSGRFSEAVDWRLRFSDETGDLGESTGTGTEFSADWDGLVGGNPVVDGSYTWTLEAWDEWGNTPLVETGTVTVDTVAPTIDALSLTTASPAAVFSPNGDGVAETLGFSATTSEPGDVLASIDNSSGIHVVDLTAAAADRSGGLSWNGRNGNGNLVVDGLFDIDVSARDVAGNVGPVETRTVGVYGALTSVASSAVTFWPHDGDTRSPFTTLSFRLLRPATVTWEVRKLDGTVVYTRYADAALAAGSYAFQWRGRDQAGAPVAPGVYIASVRAANATLGTTQSLRFQMNAFAIRSSDSTPRRGQRITIYATSAEWLKSAPRLRVDQPGIGYYMVVMTRVSGQTYRATITLRSSAPGNVRFKVGGYDLGGRYQWTTAVLPLG
jgi:flagellar hook capping protein FlgD